MPTADNVCSFGGALPRSSLHTARTAHEKPALRPPAAPPAQSSLTSPVCSSAESPFQAFYGLPVSTKEYLMGCSAVTKSVAEIMSSCVRLLNTPVLHTVLSPHVLQGVLALQAHRGKYIPYIPTLRTKSLENNFNIN